MLDVLIFVFSVACQAHNPTAEISRLGQAELHADLVTNIGNTVFPRGHVPRVVYPPSVPPVMKPPEGPPPINATPPHVVELIDPPVMKPPDKQDDAPDGFPKMPKKLRARGV